MPVTEGFPTIAEIQGSMDVLFTYSIAFVLVWFISYYSLGMSEYFSASKSTQKLVAASITVALGFVLGDLMMSYNILGMFF